MEEREALDSAVADHAPLVGVCPVSANSRRLATETAWSANLLTERFIWPVEHDVWPGLLVMRQLNIHAQRHMRMLSSGMGRDSPASAAPADVDLNITSATTRSFAIFEAFFQGLQIRRHLLTCLLAYAERHEQGADPVTFKIKFGCQA